MKRIERALISVYDKTGVVEFARGLAALDVEILSTGGTHRLLQSHAIPVREVADYTGFPEMLDGRVKTIHPRIAAGLLAIRSRSDHMQQLEQHDIPRIDLVCVNLYPFVETIRKPGVSFEEAIENIDIGGPSMIRAAAKNFQDIAVVTAPADYAAVLDLLTRGNGVLDRETLLELARKAFLSTARYDAQIAQYLSKTPDDVFPDNLFMDFEKISGLRYGENPHQKAAFYRWGGQPEHGLAAARQDQGKELSYNNIVDLEAAWNLASDFDRPACCIIKHTNPCGAAVADTLAAAYLRAFEADSVSAFGSVIGLNRTVDAATAAEIVKLFVEAIVAPGFEAEARAMLSAKKNLRLVSMESIEGAGSEWADYEIKRVFGGVLLQQRDTEMSDTGRVVSRRQPSDTEWMDLRFAWRVVKHVKSNAIVLAAGGRTAGIGAGQMSRVDAVKIAIQKAYPTANGAVLASDAFFPFRDGIDAAAKAGVTAIIQPGGSVRDEEAVAAVDEHGMAMVFTGLRHFRH